MRRTTVVNPPHPQVRADLKVSENRQRWPKVFQNVEKLPVLDTGWRPEQAGSISFRRPAIVQINPENAPAGVIRHIHDVLTDRAEAEQILAPSPRGQWTSDRSDFALPTHRPQMRAVSYEKRAIRNFPHAVDPDETRSACYAIHEACCTTGDGDNPARRFAPEKHDCRPAVVVPAHTVDTPIGSVEKRLQSERGTRRGRQHIRKAARLVDTPDATQCSTRLRIRAIDRIVGAEDQLVGMDVVAKPLDATTHNAPDRVAWNVRHDHSKAVMNDHTPPFVTVDAPGNEHHADYGHGAGPHGGIVP